MPHDLTEENLVDRSLIFKPHFKGVENWIVYNNVERKGPRKKRKLVTASKEDEFAYLVGLGGHCGLGSPSA